MAAAMWTQLCSVEWPNEPQVYVGIAIILVFHVFVISIYLCNKTSRRLGQSRQYDTYVTDDDDIAPVLARLNYLAFTRQTRLMYAMMNFDCAHMPTSKNTCTLIKSRILVTLEHDPRLPDCQVPAKLYRQPGWRHITMVVFVFNAVCILTQVQCISTYPCSNISAIITSESLQGRAAS
jgi:hypothetical protein